jgi:hypothetical protein
VGERAVCDDCWRTSRCGGWRSGAGDGKKNRGLCRSGPGGLSEAPGVLFTCGTGCTLCCELRGDHSPVFLPFPPLPTLLNSNHLFSHLSPSRRGTKHHDGSILCSHPPYRRPDPRGIPFGTFDTSLHRVKQPRACKSPADLPRPPPGIGHQPRRRHSTRSFRPQQVSKGTTTRREISFSTVQPSLGDLFRLSQEEG